MKAKAKRKMTWTEFYSDLGKTRESRIWEVNQSGLRWNHGVIRCSKGLCPIEAVAARRGFKRVRGRAFHLGEELGLSDFLIEAIIDGADNNNTVAGNRHRKRIVKALGISK